MTIIELLNKIANGEDTPKEIKYDGYTFKKANESYIEEDGDNLTDHICYDYSNLNDEVEIIEEDKKIEKLIYIPINYADDRKPEEVYEYLRCTINNLADVINISNENLFELIDKVNSLENKQ